MPHIKREQLEILDLRAKQGRMDYAEPPRFEFEGTVCHVMARGNRREPIVFDQAEPTCR